MPGLCFTYSLKVIRLASEEIKVTINRKRIEFDVQPQLINDRTMVPLRFISESLGKQVAWDAREQTAIIIDYDYCKIMNPNS